MNTPKISWEIVLAGLAFIGVGIYLFNNNTSSKPSAATWQSQHNAPHPPSEPSFPGAVVIDLKNLKNLKNLENLKNLKNIKNLEDLEIKLRNIDKIIEKNTQNKQVQKNLEQSLQQLETELQKIDKADFKVKLQDQKVYINKNYNVDEAKWTEVSPGIYVFRESFSAPNLESMNLNLGFGNLNIVGSNSQQGELTLRATGDLEDPAKFSENLAIQKNLTAADASFHLSPAKDSNISNQINLEATLTLPKNTKLIAHTSGGHITASDLNSRQDLQTSGGHISLDDIHGETVAKTDGGHITGNEISGNTLLSTGGGHIKITGSSGSLTAKTGGGHIEIQDASGSVIAKTSGGNISTSVTQADGPLKFFTSAGNISLMLPTEISADLDVSGSSVHLADGFNFSGTKHKGNISGSINGGGLPVVVNCGYGNVNISTNE